MLSVEMILESQCLYVLIAMSICSTLILSTLPLICIGVRSEDTSMADRILNALWEDVKWEVRKEVDFMKKRYGAYKIALNEALVRLEELERNNQELRDMITESQRGENCSWSADNTYVPAAIGRTPTLKLAMADQESGNIHVVDTVSGARWVVGSVPGIRGIASHTLSKTFYTISRNGRDITAILFPEKKRKLIRKCSRCLALSLDAQQNILYFLEEDKIRYKVVYLQRVSLLRNEAFDAPLIRYSVADDPRALFVDDVARVVHVVLSHSIHHADYFGKTISMTHLAGLIKPSSSVAITVDKHAGILFHAIDGSIWRQELNSHGHPKLIFSSNDILSSVIAFGSRLIVSYLTNGRVDEIRRAGVNTLMTFSGLEKTKQYLCFFEW